MDSKSFIFLNPSFFPLYGTTLLIFPPRSINMYSVSCSQELWRDTLNGWLMVAFAQAATPEKACLI